MRRIKLARTLQRISDFLPRKYPVKATSELEKSPFFIFGSGRNGSTLLNRMLNQHSELFLPSEQYFLGNSIIKFKLYNFLIWRDLVKIVTGELLPVTGSHTWDFSPEEIFDSLNHIEDRSLQAGIDLIYKTYGAKQKQFVQWGDTTPLNTFYLPEVFSVFPKGKYIFLLRDGRDVVASYKKGGDFLGELTTPMNAARHWVRSIEKYDWLKRRTDILVVRYEDLVTKPDETLGTICSHLGVAYEPKMLDFHQVALSNALYQEPQHANLNQPIFKASIGNFEQGLSDEEIEDVTEIMRKGLTRFGYL